MKSGWTRQTQSLLLSLFLLLGLAPLAPVYSEPVSIKKPVKKQPRVKRSKSNARKSVARQPQQKSVQQSKLKQNKSTESELKEINERPAILPDWHSLREVGRGTAIVFSPDIARPANQSFYEKLGFLYIETADWNSVIDQIASENNDEVIIHTVILETHGNQGHGLKLQTGKTANSDRSYISLGALRQALDGSGVERCIITACNAGRLNRPDIYNRLDQRKLLKANFGVINASSDYDPAESSVQLLRRNESELEMLSAVKVRELPRSVRDELELDNEDEILTISDLTIQYILQDPSLKLTDMGYEVALSKKKTSLSHSERLIATLFSALSRVTSLVEGD